MDTSCCIPSALSEGQKHSHNCPRHCTDAQIKAEFSILQHEDQRLFFGYCYPQAPGEPLEIHDPNKRVYWTVLPDGRTTSRPDLRPPEDRGPKTPRLDGDHDEVSDAAERLDV